MDQQRNPWIVLIDGEIEERHPTRADARIAKAWHMNHPSIRDLRRFGNGGMVRVVSQAEYETESDREFG